MKNVEIIGIRNTCVVSESTTKLAKVFHEYFDKILVDAPCSGEGMFRKQPSIMKNWEQYGVGYYNKLQKEIITDCATMLRPGGYMVYSTCTFSPEENEGTVKFLKENFPEFEVCDAIQIAKEHYGDKVDYTGFDFGHPDWADAPEEVKHCIRLWPHKIPGEGHFVTLLRKNDGSTAEVTHQEETKRLDVISVMKQSKVSLSDETIEFLERLPMKFGKGEFKLRKEMLYYVPEVLTDNFGLRTLRHGLLLGEMKKNRFEPSQALASSMRMGDYDNVLNLSVEDPNVIKYLKCETIDVEEDKILEIPRNQDGQPCYSSKLPKDGWVLVCVDNYPLGWGKLSNGSVKNKYLSGWRWM